MQIVVNVSSKRKFKISLHSLGEVFVAEVWDTRSCTCPDFQKNGAEVSSKHLLLVLMFILKEEQIVDDDVEASSNKAR